MYIIVFSLPNIQVYFSKNKRYGNNMSITR